MAILTALEGLCGAEVISPLSLFLQVAAADSNGFVEWKLNQIEWT